MAKRGRPPGSKNKSTLLAIRLPASCPKCGSADIARRPGSLVRTLPYGREVNGVIYARVRIIPSACRACGQSLLVREPTQ